MKICLVDFKNRENAELIFAGWFKWFGGGKLKSARWFNSEALESQWLMSEFLRKASGDNTNAGNADPMTPYGKTGSKLLVIVLLQQQ